MIWNDSKQIDAKRKTEGNWEGKNRKRDRERGLEERGKQWENLRAIMIYLFIY